MDDFLDLMKFCALTIAALAAVGLGITGAVAAGEYALARPSCYAHWSGSAYQARWSFWGDCQISADGKIWMPEDAYLKTHKDVSLSQN